MGYRLNRLDKPVLMAGAEPMQTEFDIHHRLESCDWINLNWIQFESFKSNCNCYSTSKFSEVYVMHMLLLFCVSTGLLVVDSIGH